MNNKFNFFNMQYSDSSNEIDSFKEKNNKVIIEEFKNIDMYNDFDSLASILKKIDLFITVSNSTAHLAASLGKPVWMPLPYWAEMRWMENTENSPWYQSLLLLRQKSENDWENVLNMIEEAFK